MQALPEIHSATIGQVKVPWIIKNNTLAVVLFSFVCKSTLKVQILGTKGANTRH